MEERSKLRVVGITYPGRVRRLTGGRGAGGCAHAHPSSAADAPPNTPLAAEVKANRLQSWRITCLATRPDQTAPWCGLRRSCPNRLCPPASPFGSRQGLARSSHSEKNTKVPVGPLSACQHHRAGDVRPFLDVSDHFLRKRKRRDRIARDPDGSADANCHVHVSIAGARSRARQRTLRQTRELVMMILNFIFGRFVRRGRRNSGNIKLHTTTRSPRICGLSVRFVSGPVKAAGNGVAMETQCVQAHHACVTNSANADRRLGRRC